MFARVTEFRIFLNHSFPCTMTSKMRHKLASVGKLHVTNFTGEFKSMIRAHMTLLTRFPIERKFADTTPKRAILKPRTGCDHRFVTFSGAGD